MVAKGKISKNQQTNRQVQEGSKDSVKVIVAFKSKAGTTRFKEHIMHKDKVAAFLESQG